MRYRSPKRGEQLAVTTFNYKGFDIPLHLAHMTGGADDTFDRISKEHIGLAERAIALREGLSVLEVGCGIGRDAIPLIDRIGKTGRYVGIDIVAEMIDWCKAAITSAHPNFTFHHFDVADKWYNPSGTVTVQQCALPAEDGSVDLIILQSVFTHMLEPDITHYLREFSRVLSPRGRVVASFFLVNQEILESQGPKSYITFSHNIAPGCYVHELEKPSHAVAFTEEALNRMLDASGLSLAEPPLYGIWSGRRQTPVAGQDIALLKLRGSAN
jgi:ubiquinone/menaquinone biosynthesis C-methylase UbiE